MLAGPRPPFLAAAPKGDRLPHPPKTLHRSALVKDGSPEANPQRQVARTPGKAPSPIQPTEPPGPSRLAVHPGGTPPLFVAGGLPFARGRLLQPAHPGMKKAHLFLAAALVAAPLTQVLATTVPLHQCGPKDLPAQLEPAQLEPKVLPRPSYPGETTYPEMPMDGRIHRRPPYTHGFDFPEPPELTPPHTPWLVD